MRDKLKRIGWALLAVLFLVTGVGISVLFFGQSPQQNQNNQNLTESANQLRGKPLANFSPVAKVDSLQKIDQQVGNGAYVTPDSTVTVIYTGAVASTGIVFESSADTGQPVTFKLNQVIKGWQEGLPGTKAGGQRRLLIPASLAYGANPPPGSGIPVNADLVFDITLLSVQ